MRGIRFIAECMVCVGDRVWVSVFSGSAMYFVNWLAVRRLCISVWLCIYLYMCLYVCVYVYVSVTLLIICDIFTLF